MRAFQFLAPRTESGRVLLGMAAALSAAMMIVAWAAVGDAELPAVTCARAAR